MGSIDALLSRRHLFKGDSCNPLSPRLSKSGEYKEGISGEDQLLIVLKAVENRKELKETRRCFVQDKHVENYLDNLDKVVGV